MSFEPAFLDRYLHTYYTSLYPVDLICKWLSYNKPASDYFVRREIAFILKSDIHLRYLSFNDASDFREKLGQKVPYKVDIGAVYNRPPKEKKMHDDFRTEQRELVLDIDLTDYDAYRTCCEGTNVCAKCWRFIVIAVKVLERLLRTHFGFQNLLWVFSGRRGVHCWVADQRARELNNFGREAISKYLKFDKNGAAMNKYRVHPMIEHAYRTIMDGDEIEEVVLEQRWLADEERWKAVLALCDDPQTREVLHAEFLDCQNAKQRWMLLKLHFDEKSRRGRDMDDLPAPPSERAKHFLRIFVLSHVYPKLDEKVTAQLNHLLKSPFSIHPKNGQIAVPIRADEVDRFDLDNVPRVDKLFAEVQKIQSGSEENAGGDALRKRFYKETALAPYIANFEAFVNGVLSRC